MRLVDDEGGKRWMVSYSGLDRFRSCPEKYRAVMAGEVVDMPGEEAFRGIFAHAACAAHIERNVGTKRLADPLSVIAEAAHAEIDNYASSGLEIPWTTTTLYAAEELYDVWRVKARPKLPDGDLLAERKFEFDFGLTSQGLPVHSRGVIDVVALEACILVDWKFSGATHWTREWWKHDRYDHQPTLYIAAAETMTGIEMEHWEFYYAIVNTKDSTVDIRPASKRDHADLGRLRREVNALATLCETNPDGPWPMIPNDWHCSPKRCRAWDQCMGSFGAPAWALSK